MGNKLVSWLLFILLCFIWGSSFILMKESKEALNAVQIAALRIFSASLAFLPFAFFHFKKIPRNRLAVVCLTGVFGNLIPAFMFATAIMKLDSSLTGILNSLTPICVVVLGAIFFRDRIHPQKILGVLVGFAGLCLLTFTQHDISLHNLGYTSLVVIGTLSYGLNINLVSHYLKGINPVQAATVSLSLLVLPTGLILWIGGFFTLNFQDPVIQWAVLNSVILGVVGSALATALFYMLVQKAGGLFASLVTYGIPFVALFWGYIDGEQITLIEILCLGIILAGVFLANRKVRESGS